MDARLRFGVPGCHYDQNVRALTARQASRREISVPAGETSISGATKAVLFVLILLALLMALYAWDREQRSRELFRTQAAAIGSQLKMADVTRLVDDERSDTWASWHEASGAVGAIIRSGLEDHIEIKALLRKINSKWAEAKEHAFVGLEEIACKEVDGKYGRRMAMNNVGCAWAWGPRVGRPDK
jgi:hypothetical protein